MPFIDLLFQSPEQLAPANPETVSLFNLKDWAQYQLSDLMIQYDRTTLLIYICIMIIGSFLLKNLFAFLQTYFMVGVEQGVIRDIRQDLYSHMHNLSLGYYTEERKGNLISRLINDVRIINDSMVWVINVAFRNPPQLIGYTYLLFIFNWKLTLALMFALPVAGVILSKIGDQIKKISIKSQEKISDITIILDETLSSMRIVKAFNMEGYEIDRFGKANYNYYKTILDLTRKKALASPITEMVGVLFITMVLYFMGMDLLAGGGSMTPGAFVLYIGVIFQMMPSLKLLGQVFNSVKEGVAASERVFNVLDTDPEIKDKPDAVELKSFDKKIEFRNVSFKYETSDYVLRDVDLSVKKGEIVALAGPSGAGKSTLVDLIPRFYDVKSGSIMIDGIDIRDYKVQSIRDLMGVVTQETILFNDSIRNNIAYGSTDITEEQIIDAAKAANAHEFISAVDKGYDSVIGDRGVKLSGGQRQRLSIARALLKNPPILILDEATSALDTESEQLVQSAIENLMKGRTSIVIAHRLSTIMHADKIVVLENGKIVEIGKHEELLAQNGLYEKLYNMQFKKGHWG